jgi:hypothetical protein
MQRLIQIIVIPIIVWSVTGIFLFSQDKEGKVKYTPDFKFNDGIYVNFNQVKSNSPIPKAKLLTSSEYNDRDFFNKIFTGDKIYYYDEMGIRQEIEKNNIWGYSRNGVMYIMIQGNFNRITFFGSICHFVADITTYENRNYYSPYGYYDPYYSPFGYSSYYSPYSPYGSYYSPYRQNSISRNELKQYIIDTETGKVMDFNVENVKLLLMKDPTVYDEYVQLSKKKKKELMFVYIRKFNEKNPLYLPLK